MESKFCQICNQAFSCGASTGKCWCMDLPTAPELPATIDDCICQKCLQHQINTQKQTPSLIENLDFYYENGYMVFTAHYLSKRGYCCNSGCRHCPYK